MYYVDIFKKQQKRRKGMANNSICYKNNYIDKMIIRIDFFKNLDSDTIFNDEIIKTISFTNPIIKPKQLITTNSIDLKFSSGLINSDGIKQTKIESYNQEFHDSKGNKIIISNKSLVYEVNYYESFEKIKDVFFPIIKIIFDKAKPTIERTGVRFINIFNENVIKIKKVYFAKEISSIIDIKANNNNTESFNLIRSMNLSEYRFDNMILNFRFGLYNPNYPMFINSNNFVLDYDCFLIEHVNNEVEVMNTIDKAHNNIQLLFEKSITDELRKNLNE